ncbi:MAG: hypothetical protein PHW34_13500 [Hespellia sp.]|nr:hypothetical protein [Hespellia sp.]
MSIIIVIFIILRIIYHKQNNLQKNNDGYYHIRSKEYSTEIYNNTPVEHQQSIRKLYGCLEQLDDMIGENNRALNVQVTQSAEMILRKAADAEREITEYWQINKKKADFYYYIGLHYTSFTLADKLTVELVGLKKINVLLSDTIDRIQSQIDGLKKEMDNANEAKNIRKIKREHQELCKKCDALRKTRKLCTNQMKVCRVQRDSQNIITADRREYIGKHFGAKGRQWRSRIMEKHKKL